MVASALGVVLSVGCTLTERSLAAGESIAGTVTDAADHAGIEGVEVCAWLNSFSEPEPSPRCVSTAADGGYEIAPLISGTYRIEFWPRGGGLNYVAQFYDDQRYWSHADPVYTGNVPTDGIDAEMHEGGEIEGRVTSDVGGAPIEEVLVCAQQDMGDGEPGCDLTGADGEYTIVGLREGDYTVEFVPEHNGLEFLGEFYDDEWSWWRGDRIPVSVGNVTSGIDAALEPASEIRGEVTAAASGAHLQGILVCIAPPLDYDYFYFSDFGQCQRTDSAGEYAFGGLEAGQYKAMFSVELWEYIHQIPPMKPDPDGYPTVYWNEKPTWAEADVLTLTAPTIATANARLGPPAQPLPPVITVSPTPSAQPVSRPKKRRCRPGLTRRKVKGKRRCVRRHRKHPHPRHRHTRPSRSLAALEIRSLDH
jgi:hypothetical protein